MPKQICEVSASSWVYYKAVCYDAARSRECKKKKDAVCSSGLFWLQGRELDAEEIDETEEDDRTKFKDQLQTIGSFGRQVWVFISLVWRENRGISLYVMFSMQFCEAQLSCHGCDWALSVFSVTSGFVRVMVELLVTALAIWQIGLTVKTPQSHR